MKPERVVSSPVGDEIQQSLFDEPVEKLRRKRVRPKPKRSKGLQYRIKLTIRATPRKIAYRQHAAAEDEGNDHTWSLQDIQGLHTTLLDESLAAIRGYADKQSPRMAEILEWMRREGELEPFSFNTCCRLYRRVDEDGVAVGPLDPDAIRGGIRRLVRQVFPAGLPHAKVLRKGIAEAEAGNLDAIEWVLGDLEGPLTFAACCDAIGFDAEDARTTIRLPSPLKTGRTEADRAHRVA